MKNAAAQKKYFALKIIFVHFVDACEDFFSKEDKLVNPLNCCTGNGEIQEEASILPRRFLGAGDAITFCDNSMKSGRFTRDSRTAEDTCMYDGKEMN
mmetsp:Transcript_21957/g.46172  ORF Transcript_21957/g.46172 Transcript_21957/m.46172 type:complete len:97 (-) Transcript_21957:213-503(-)